jgi:hypothetical protein
MAPLLAAHNRRLLKLPVAALVQTAGRFLRPPPIVLGTVYVILEMQGGLGKDGGMGRIARVVVPGMAHHVTQRGNRRILNPKSGTDYEFC